MFGCFLAMPVYAANLNVIPAVSLQETWDSNIFNTSSGEESDFIFRAVPSLTIVIQAFHTSANITGGFQLERYADHDELNETVATQNFNLSVTEPFRITPRFSLRPLASYVETRDSVRRNELAQPTTVELPPPETVVTERRKARDYRAGLQMMYLLTPNLDLSVGGGISKREFVEDVTGTDLEDSRSITGDLSVLYRLSQRFFSGIFINTSYNTFDNSTDSRTFGGGLAGRYILSEHYTFDARIGASYLKESADATGQENKEWTPYGRLSLGYAWQNFIATLLGSYELAGGGSFGQTTKRGSVILTLTDRFAERWWWNIAGLYQNNKSTNGPVTEDIDTFQGTAGIRYAVFQWASLQLAGNVIRQRSNLTGGGEGDLNRESIFLGFNIGKPYQVY